MAEIVNTYPVGIQTFERRQELFEGLAIADWTIEV